MHKRKAHLLDFSKEVTWERAYLKKKCKEVGVEREYVLYERRLHCNAIGVFLFLHSAVTLLHCALLLWTCEYKNFIYIDVFAYLGNAVITIMVLSINFNDKIVQKHPWIMYVTSAIAVLLMIVVDLALNLYHYYCDYWSITSFYDAYVLLVIYFFLPLPFLTFPILFGATVTIAYSTYFFFYLAVKYQYGKNNVVNFNHILVDLLHFLCFNLMGIFYRVISDIIVRSSFLDRHQYVIEVVRLRSARMQEKLLLDSILPPQIARVFQANIRNRIAIAGRERGYMHMHRQEERIMAVQHHIDVSILYADVVNYTHLTTTLSVKELVRLLHDLYGRFDVAASHFRVQRIKFLGDCYYCVAGLTQPDPDHAKCCVDLGHCMIAQIREVRANTNTDIDMRIGVHSGSCLAGAIGSAKLQFDIWGDDVTIANLLEATGRPGHIHISDRTLGLLMNNSYEILPGTQEARNNEFLQSQRIQTYLIAAIDVLKSEPYRSYSIASLERVSSDKSEDIIERELHEELAKMPVGAFHVKKFLGFWKMKQSQTETDYSRPHVGFFLLHFLDSRLEYKYMRQPDYLIKYSLLLAWGVSLSLVYMQIVSHTGPQGDNLVVNSIVMLVMTVQLFISWYKKLCYMRFKKMPGHRFSNFSYNIFKIADTMQRNLIARMIIYMTTIVGYFSVIGCVLMDCNIREFELSHIESKLYSYEPDLYTCFHPWVLTHMVCLIMAMSMNFTRIPWMVKLIVCALEALTYMIIMLFQFEYIVHHSLTTNPFFLSEYAHSFIVLITLLNLYFMERQSEFNNRVNFNWKVELLKKQQDAHMTNKSITILLMNILPSHVVDVYLANLAKHELYHENYKLVAVMFASLQNFQLDLPNLRILNEIICEFDQILSHYKSDYKVEKIKIVGCTYMAACGLDPSVAGRQSRGSEYNDSISEEVLRAQRFLVSYRRREKSIVQNEEVVFVLTTFALDLMRTLWVFKKVYNQMTFVREMPIGDLSIGISSGEVMAGVVGASQVHYDIWGNPVNMASRMCSTGVAGKIQVTEESALILGRFGIQCNYRGETYVKGRGILPTYFVGIGADYEFIRTPEYLQREAEIKIDYI